jgi:hypothetical protein
VRYRIEVALAATLLIACVIAWPVSVLTFASDEPSTVLSLSWLAPVLACAEWLKSARIHRDQQQQPCPNCGHQGG